MLKGGQMSFTDKRPGLHAVKVAHTGDTWRQREAPAHPLDSQKAGYSYSSMTLGFGLCHLCAGGCGAPSGPTFTKCYPLVSVTPIYHALANGKGYNEPSVHYEVQDALPTFTTINLTTVHRGTSAAWSGVVCTSTYNTLAVNALSSYEKPPFFVWFEE